MAAPVTKTAKHAAINKHGSPIELAPIFVNINCKAQAGILEPEYLIVQASYPVMLFRFIAPTYPNKASWIYLEVFCEIHASTGLDSRYKFSRQTHLINLLMYLLTLMHYN